MDDIFEYEFSLAMANNGYSSLNDTIIKDIENILTYKQLSLSQEISDKSLDRLHRLYKETIMLWGYDGIKGIDIDEVVDICKRISLYESNPADISDLIYIKTVNRASIINRYIETIDCQKYKKYYKHFEYITLWLKKIM